MTVDSSQDFTALMHRVRCHSEGAAQELIGRYGTTLLRVVRQHLSRHLRSKFDSVDFVQAVWASFFALESERLKFEGPDALGAFLAQVAHNKVVDVVRQRLQSLKYDVRREVPLDRPGGDQAMDLAGHAPTPVELAIAREEWERLLDHRPAHHQEILTLLAFGNSPRQVAEQLGLHENSIRRVVRKVKRSSAHE